MEKFVGFVTMSMVLPGDRLSGRSRFRLALALAVASGILGLAMSQPALGASSGAFAWGNNEQGQLGNGTSNRSDVPVAVSGLSEVTAVAGGASSSLALLSNGTVMAWGEGGVGQLGNGTTKSSDVPVVVSGLDEVTALAAGGNHNLALLRNGTIMAWGYNAFGQLGNGTTTNSDVPVAVSALKEVTDVAAGYNYSLALLRNGTVMAWGYNEFGDLGNGTTKQQAYPTPAPVSGLHEVTAIAAGLGGVSTALLSDGTVMDWGYGQFGELGDGTTNSSDVPVAVSGLSGVAALPDGGQTMALLSNGTVVDWGLDSVGLLGDGLTNGPETCEGIPCSRVPVAVSGLTGVTAIAGGFEHRLALLRNGKVMAWGNGSGGELGQGADTGSDVPVEASGLSGVATIATGQYFSLAGGGQSTGPRPTITRLSSKFGPAAGDATVTVTGANLTGATAVDFGSTSAASFTVNSSTSITALSPAGTARTVDVTVTTPGGTSAVSSHDHYRLGPPTVTSVIPETGSTAGETVTITGSGFGLGMEVTTIKFGSTVATMVDCSSTTTCSVVAPSHRAGTVDVRAVVSGMTSAKNPPGDQFTYS